MRRTYAVAVATALAAAVAVAGLPSATAAAVTPQPCEQLAVSPAYDADRTVFCAGIVRDADTGAATGLRLFTSADRGVSWRAVAPTGLALAADERLRDVIVSPGYATDRTLVVHLVLGGLHRSTDGGATFTPLYPLKAESFTAFTGTPAGVPVGGAGARPLLVGPAPNTVGGAVVVDPSTGLVHPAPGTSPLVARAFLVSPTFATDGAAFALASTAAGATERVELYRCTAAFACTELAEAFPVRYRLDRAWLAGDYATSRTVYVSLLDTKFRTRLYRSRDGGATFAAWTSAQALLDPSYAQGTLPEFSVAPRAGSRTVWLRVVGGEKRADPAARLFRSDDGGTRWTLVAYGRGHNQRGPRGTLPMSGVYGGSLAGGETPGGFVATAGRTDLYVLSRACMGRGLGAFPFVSRDSGRTWRGYCPAR